MTHDLKRKLANANGKVKEIERERTERRKVLKKTRVVEGAAPTNAQTSASVVTEASTDDVAMVDVHEDQGQGTGKEKAKDVVPGELEEETVFREREKMEFEAAIDPELKADVGASVTGLFELCGECTFMSVLCTRADVLCSCRGSQGCVGRRGTLHRVCEEGCISSAKGVLGGG